MNLQDLNELDFSNIGIWPTPVKAVAILLLCVALLVGWYYYNTEEQLLSLEKSEKKELQLRAEFEQKQAKAANLEKYKKQLAEMEQSFGTMLRQLPDKTEVADLLVDVSQTGLAAGLEFELFAPKREVPREFYAEMPISIRVHGNYHEFGEFISGLAALPRIVTIHNVQINPKGKIKTKDNPLVMNATAKTYRYLDEEARR